MTAARSESLQLRRVGPGDVEAVADLLGTVFDDNPKADPAVLRWQFFDNPNGEAASYVWEHPRDGVVSHFALFPIPGVLDGRARTLSKPADAATRRAYRGQGLFRDAARRSMAEMAGRGIPLTVCTPNDNARPGLRQLGMIDVGGVDTHVLPVDPAWTAARLHLPEALVRAGMGLLRSPPRSPEAEEVAVIPAEAGGLWQVTAPHVDCGSRRDLEWLRWRYDDRPGDPYRRLAVGRHGRLQALAVVRLREIMDGQVLHVLELMATQPDAAQAAVHAAVSAVGEAVALAAVSRRGTALSRLLRRAGLRRVPAVLLPRRFNFGILPHEPEAAAWADREWTLTWGDLDHL